jgi:hypothetical protein
VSRSWVSLTAPVALAALALLSLTVASLLRTVRGSVVALAPIRAQQGLTFNTAGDLVLNVEGRMLASSARDLRFTLTRPNGGPGSVIPLRPVVFRTEVSSSSRARLELYRFTLPAAGPYALRISGIDPTRDYSSDTIVFTRPVRAAIVVHVLSLIVFGAVFIGLLVVSGLSLARRPVMPAPTPSPQPISRPTTLEDAIARSVAIVRARTVMRGGTPRYQVLETWAGAVPSQLAGAGQSEGLIVDPGIAMARGYRPVEGQYVILLLAQPSAHVAERPSVVLAEPIEILPIVDGRVVYAPRSLGTRRELTIADLRRLTRR